MSGRPMRIDGPEQLRALMGTSFTFSAPQFAAITAPLSPGVIIAGAGSGKTSVMAARVVWLVATGQVSSDQVLGLTFTTKATNELAQRIRGSLRDADLVPAPGAEGEVEEPTVATYHSYAANLLSEHGLRIGHEPDTRLVADASRYQLAARAVARFTKPIPHLTDHPETAIKNLLALDSAMTEHLVQPQEVRDYDAKQRPLFLDAIEGETRKTYRDKNEKAVSAIDRRADLLDLVEAYRALKADLGLMDFADQIALAAQLARDSPEVGEAQRERFRVVLLDEYQDTSVAQALMLRRLFSGPDIASGLGHPVTAVGDPNQAIYGWRGASVSNIVNFVSEFPGESGEAASYPLLVNRRSDRRILDAANHLGSELYDGHPELWPLEPKEEAAEGTVRVAVHETYDDELAWLPAQVIEFHESMTRPCWKEIGVLTRDNAHAAAVFDALTGQEIPVEIVGLKGLLRLPEVAEVVATLTLLQDVTANASLLTLLTGPRWAVGPRDLALLGRRARNLAAESGRAGGSAPEPSLAQELEAAVEGSDPMEIACLSDALEDPGRLDYSSEARDRFALLADELRKLRAAVGEPLLDLIRRIIETTGIDIELASSVSPAAAARRDNLDLFVKAVAEFQGVDGAVTLPALLAWLDAEDEFGNGLDVATPTEANSVKLLTVHRAKGLEWDAVFLVGVAERKFPTERSRSKWVTSPAVLPTDLRGDRADLPVLRGHTRADLEQLNLDAKAYESVEERRLGYVAWTRARHELVVSSYCWTPKNKTSAGPSEYQLRTRESLRGWGAEPELWWDKPPKEAANPYAARDSDRAWPITHHTPEAARRVDAAARVRTAVGEDTGGAAEDDGLDMLELQRVQEWDDEMARLLDEAARQTADTIVVPLPASLSATALARLRDDPERFAAELARPMPRQPSSAARFGTRFHAWVESRFGQQQLVGLDEVPGRGDAGIEDEAELQELVKAFTAGPFGERVPFAVEPPFALVLAGQVVRGRIDAVYQTPTGFLLVDWKTNQKQTADPLQLAIYRVAWAELQGVPLDQVEAAFFYVRTGDLVEQHDLPDRAALENLVAEPAQSEPRTGAK